MTSTDERRLDAWERRTGWPLTGIAFAFLVAYAWPILDPGLAPGQRRVLGIFSVATWAVFLCDYVIRVTLADDRRHFLRRHVFDLAVIALPMLRPLRALRVLAVIGFLNRQTGGAFRGRVIAYVIAATTLVVAVAALAMLDAERQGPAPNITTIGDALWWGATTITTVGYGDRYPTTAEGRLIGLGLMLAGIALLGVVTASFASWFLDKVSAFTAAEKRAEVTLEHVLSELHELRVELRGLRGGDSG
ncbi:MAG: voltage-gated potassium channel [Actinomycetota bacterium]|jgi:voltage-gated potassium channel|nr:voltage-gated potassium channel [Actinomycetota bacterium]